MTPEEIKETFRYHSPSPEAVDLHERIRDKMVTAVDWIARRIPHSRERSAFITKMQEAQMMANAAVAIHGPPRDGEQRPDPDLVVYRSHPDPDRIIYAATGSVHKPTPENPVWKWEFRLGRYLDGVGVAFTMRTGARTFERRGSKLLFLGENMKNLCAFAVVRKGAVILRSGFGIPIGPKKPKRAKRFRLAPNTAYEVVLEWRPDSSRLYIDGKLVLDCPCPGDPPKRAFLTLGGDGSVAEAVQEGFVFSDLTVSALSAWRNGDG